MPHPDGSYEIHRDNERFPHCFAAKNNQCVPHFHGSLELLYLVSGEMEVVLNGTPVTVREKQLLVVPSYSVHIYTSPQKSRCMVLLLPLDYIPSFQKLANRKSFAQTLLPAGPAAARVAASMRAVLSTPRPASERTRTAGQDSYAVRGHIYLILDTLLQELPMEELSRDSDRYKIRNVLNYLHRNFQQPLSLETLAGAFGYSRSRFSVVFNRNVGCSIPEYLNMLRARHAASLMLEEDHSVTEAALAAGFESTRTFYRAFRACFGMTASEYLRAGKQPEAI